MSLFVDFVGLNTLVSSSFETDVFDNIITSNLANSAPAVATIVYTGTSAVNDTITVSDGYLGGGVGPITFTAVSGTPAANQWFRSIIADTNFNNMCTAINDYPGLNLNASNDIGTNTITITNLFNGSAGNGSITYGVGTPPFSSNDGFVGGLGIDGAQKLPAINLHRNGPYNFATFKQIRIHENPLTRYQRRNNLLSFTKRPVQRQVTDSNNRISFIQEKFGDLVTFTEPALVSSYHPLVYNLGSYKGDKKLFIERFGLSFDYGNHTTYFTNDELNKLLFLDDLDDEVYEQIKELYLNGALETNASEVDYFEFLRYKQDIYPREINKYSANVRQRTNYQNDFWRDVRADRVRSADSGFGYTLDSSMWNLDPDILWTTRTSSLNIGTQIANTYWENKLGILQNRYSHFSDATGHKYITLAAAPIYSRLHTVTTSGSVASPTGIVIPETASVTNMREFLFQGDALWEAGTQAGKNPFYSSYDHFVEELRATGKDFSIVPEFRISDHVETLLKEGILTKLTNMLEVTGGLEASNASDESGFYETYSTSDFLKHFASIKEDHKGFEDPATITMTCKALKKFIAYDSFYPSERSVDCTQQWYSSYENHITSLKQPFLDTLFAPGVLYNTIKSGIAVDYPLITKTLTTAVFTGSTSISSHLISNRQYDVRIPFEALVEPEKYLAESQFTTNTPHPSGAYTLATTWDGKGDNLYTKMMSNYLAEIPEFFLQGSQLSTIASEEQGSDNFGVAEPGKAYAMRLKIYKTLDGVKSQEERADISLDGESAFYQGGYQLPQANIFNEETITMYSRPSAFGPPVLGQQSGGGDLHGHYDSRRGFNPIYTPPYYDGEAWMDFVWVAPELGQAGNSAGLTSRKFSLSEIMQDLTQSSLRIDPQSLSYYNFGIKGLPELGPLGASTSNTTSPLIQQFNRQYFTPTLNPVNFNAMQLNASVNAMQAGRLISRNADNDTLLNENIDQVIDVNKGATNARWVIQTKFETPILNFKDVALTTSSVNLDSAQTARGMWHQYGVIPENDEGIYMQLQDLPAGWLQWKNNDTNTVNPNWYTTGSLADLCGFSTSPVKLGQVSQGRVISEAVVAVPYINDGGVKKFFEINEDNYDSAKKYFQSLDIVNDGGNPDNLGLGNPEFWEARAGSSIIDQLRKMKRYVFPPTMDFLNYSEVTPFSMYLFEFKHTLSQQDLADIWQGLPPEIGTSFEIAEDSISHPLLANQLLGAGKGTDKSRIGASLESEIRWMVFKVKKRAKTNYFDKVVGKKAGYGQAAAAAGFSTNASSETAAQAKISYNWPYDFFSLVELVKIDAEIEFSNIPEGKFEPKKRDVPEGVQNFQANLSGVRRR